MRRLSHNFMAAISITAAMLAGCVDSTPIPTALPTTTPSVQVTVTPVSCEFIGILHQIDEMMAGSMFEAHYLTINGQLALSLWVVDPDLDPAASADGVIENTRQAFLFGASLAHKVTYQIPCVREMFDAVNPMIVDRNYNSWYVDIIPMRAMPQGEHPTDDELLTSIERSGMEIAYLRRTSPLERERAIVEGGCTWLDARVDIQKFFGDDRRNAAAYLIVGYQAASDYERIESQAFAQIQWDVHSPEEMEEQTVLQNIEQLAVALDCLSPRLDRLEVYIVDDAGRLLIFGMIPGDVIYENASSIPADRVRLHYLNRPE